MINVSNLRQIKIKKTDLIGALLVGLILSVGTAVSWRAIQHRASARQTAIERLHKDQLKASNNSVMQAVSEEHVDTIDTQFKDMSDGIFEKPTCARLRNRTAIVITDSSCNYTLRATGKATMAVVFVYDGQYSAADYNQLTDKGVNNANSLVTINSYLQTQAKRYKISNPPTVEINFFGPYSTKEPVMNIYYRPNGTKLLDIYKKTASDNSVPEQDFDMVHYVLLNQMYGGIAFPGLHRAFTYNSATVPTFVHETLHLYGASDKYNNNDCNSIGKNDPFVRYDGKLPGSDIMCNNFSLNTSMINDITAREIGWPN